MEESSNPSATSTTSAAAAGAKPHPLLPLSVPDGIRSRFVDGVNGLRMHVLEAGHPESNSTASANSASTSENGNNLAPTVILLHGFPELAYSWRKVMLPLAAAGFHVVAPDQRGFGRTTKQHQHTCVLHLPEPDCIVIVSTKIVCLLKHMCGCNAVEQLFFPVFL